MRRRIHLAAALGVEPVPIPDAGCDAMVGWGRRPSFSMAQWLAERLGKPAWAAEDAFIRSLGLGVAGAEPFGFVLDRTGIAFDATGPSDLEALIRAGGTDPAAAGLRARVVAERVTKYSSCRVEPDLPAGQRRRVLLVDQTAGDRSLALGLAGPEAFARMAAAAVAEHPDAEIVVKVHPDVVAGRRRGCLFPDRLPPGARVLSTDCDPYALLARVDAVWVATSQLGFEALLAGVPVTCFGVPWYAGWGLTDDRGPVPARRGAARTLDELFTAGYLRYSRYADPVLGGPCGLDTILDRIADHRRAGTGGRWWLMGMSWRKRRIIPRFLPGGTVAAARPGRIRAAARPGDRIAVWGTARDGEARALAAATGSAAVRIEDGFLRSVGLGSDLVRPGSLVVDDLGIYFDPRSPSRLEAILAEHPFAPAELERGAALVALLRATGITKYNTGRGRLVLPPAAAGRRTVLVPGQVEDDASILAGTVAPVRTNRALLAAARAAEPAAFLVYKPHPDVLAGNRAGAVPDAAALADLVVTDAPMDACLQAVDAVHTMTSLTGFEALVHGRAVTCHGTPFYAGWGLTDDRAPAPRRGRALPLAALVHATLVLYPRYLDWESLWFTGPEAMIELLRRRRAAAPAAVGMPRWRRLLGQLRRALPRG
jgi:capsular polysaccharide export protein